MAKMANLISVRRAGLICAVAALLLFAATGGASGGGRPERADGGVFNGPGLPTLMSGRARDGFPRSRGAVLSWLMSQCPSLSIEGCPGGDVLEGRSVSLRAEPGGASSYTWKLTVDGIDRTAEQLTANGRFADIQTAGQRGEYIASVQLGGLPAGCPTSPRACTFPVVAGPPPCPTVSVSCRDTVEEGQSVTFTAIVGGADPSAKLTFNWTVSAGRIISGQGNNSITVSTNGLGNQTITATVDVGGTDRSCSTSASCTTTVRVTPKPRKAGEYGGISSGEERARLDNFAAVLNNEPAAQGYIIAFGRCAGRARASSALSKSYLVRRRGMDDSRITIIDGGCARVAKTELWLVPPGAVPPAPLDDGAVIPCRPCNPGGRSRRTRAAKRVRTRLRER